MLESLLQLLQRFLKSPNQIRQIHSRLITNGHLRRNPNPKFSKWRTTLFYNTLIRAHLGFGEAHKAFFLFTQMLSHQAHPNSHTFPPLVKAGAGGGGWPCNGTALHAQVAKRGVWGDPVVQTSFVSMYARFGEVRDARKVFDEMTEPCVVACNAMIDGLGKNGDMGGAVSMFERMPERDVVSWTSVISGFGRNGWFGEGVWFFKRMMGSEDVKCGFVKPNEATFVSLLSSCANLDGWGSLYWGKQIHGYVVRNEVQLSVFMGTALVDLYGKSGSLSGAWNVFEEMRVKEVCTWNAMISALSLNGREKEALELFEKMKMEKRLRPNEVTFVAVLTACARGNSVKCGLDLFKSMSKNFGVEPIMEHYGCVVDLLGRAGLFKEATELLKNMPFEPDASVLGALLGSCKIHGTTELGNEVGIKLIELQPQHCGRYLVLSNIYAGNERWDHAAAVRKAMVHAGLQKIPAFSMIGVRYSALPPKVYQVMLDIIGKNNRIWGDPWSYLQPTTEINGTLIAYNRKMDRRWWRAQAVRYLMRFQTEYTCELLNVARHAAFGKQAASMVVRNFEGEWSKDVTVNERSDIEEFVWSNHKPWMPRPLLSMHVRMGDKACEMKVIEFEGYMSLADRIRKRFPQLNSVWLSTEMQEVIDKSKGYPHWDFYYTNVTRQVGNMTMATYETSLGRETSTNYPLVNFLMATEADFFIGALGSTWCFLIDGMRNTGGKVMAGYLSVNKDRFW